MDAKHTFLVLTGFLATLFIGCKNVHANDEYIDHQYDHNPLAYKKEVMKVCIYFDQVPDQPAYRLGDLYAIMTYNLLGHFREVKRSMLPLYQYQTGMLNTCDSAIYLGSHYAAPRPDSFFEDLLNFKKPFMWMNYGIWQFKEYMLKKGLTDKDFIEKTGFDFKGLVGFDEPPTVTNKTPGFFRNFRYRNKRFYKYARWNDVRQMYVTSPELVRMEVKDSKDVVCYAEHDKRPQEKTPYIVHHNQFSMVGDIPFSFIHEVDRYLIVADYLFDFLELPPRLKKKLALMRLEDIHADYEPEDIYRTTRVFASRKNGKSKKYGVPFTISVIPHFVDPMTYKEGEIFHSKKLTDSPRVLKALRYATEHNGRIIYHGYTHQDIENTEGSIGASGDGFEFWHLGYNGPLKRDELEDIKRKVLTGEEILRESGFQYDAWVTPHYQASRRSYQYFSAHFPRTIQRVRYVPVDGDEHDQINWAGQFYPYTIESDFYNQWVWPESLGNIQVKFRGVDSPFLHTVEQVLEAIDVHTVLRDTWGSFFWHSHLFQNPEVFKSLPQIVDTLLQSGFQFVDIRKLKEEEECYRDYWDRGLIIEAQRECEK